MQDTVATIPITVIVAITGDVQNAQICISAGTRNDQLCTQLFINPEQTSYTPISTDLTTETPTVSSDVQQESVAAAEPANAPTTTTESQRVPQSAPSPAHSITIEETSQP
jgi:hypothetical protein